MLTLKSFTNSCNHVTKKTPKKLKESKTVKYNNSAVNRLTET